MDQPTDTEVRRFIADRNLRRAGWAAFQKGARRAVLRMVHQMTALDAYGTAQFLADRGRTDSDSVTTADIDTAADLAGVQRPAGPDDRHTVRLALDAIGDAR